MLRALVTTLVAGGIVGLALDLAAAAYRATQTAQTVVAAIV